MPKPKGETIKDILARCPAKAKGAVRVTIFTSVWDVVAGTSLYLVSNPLTQKSFGGDITPEWESAWLGAARGKGEVAPLKRLIHAEVQKRGIAAESEPSTAPVENHEQASLLS